MEGEEEEEDGIAPATARAGPAATGALAAAAESELLRGRWWRGRLWSELAEGEGVRARRPLPVARRPKKKPGAYIHCLMPRHSKLSNCYVLVSI